MSELTVRDSALAALDCLTAEEIAALHDVLRSLADDRVPGSPGERLLLRVTPSLRVVVRRGAGVPQDVELIDVVREETLRVYAA